MDLLLRAIMSEGKFKIISKKVGQLSKHDMVLIQIS